MGTVRVNVSFPESTFDELSKEVEPRKRSRFITDAVNDFLKKKKEKKLAEEYKEASSEIRRINSELEGAISDGLD